MVVPNASMLWRWCLVLGAAVTSLPGLVQALRLEGQIPAKKDVALYVGKFCYDYNQKLDSTSGSVAISVKWDKDRVPVSHSVGGHLYFMVFDDEQKHWKKLRRRWEESTCDEKKKLASIVTWIPLSSPNATMTHAVRISEHIRPRFWYFTFVSCDLDLSTGGPIEYEVHARNIQQGWQEEVSVDHLGLAYVYLGFMVAYSVAGAATISWMRRRSLSEDVQMSDHPYISLLKLVYAASLCSCALFLAHYASLINDGYGSVRIRFHAVIASVVANCTIYLIAILSSYGWAISRCTLPNRRCFLGLITVLGAMNAGCELHAEMQIDQSAMLYSYHGEFGVLVLVLKVFMFCWFAFQVKASYDEEVSQDLRDFYKALGVSMTVWSVTVYVAVGVSNIAPWVRFKAVTSVEIAGQFLGTLLLSFVFCGPLSPISKHNTFGLRDAQQHGAFTQMDDVDDVDPFSVRGKSGLGI